MLHRVVLWATLALAIASPLAFGGLAQAAPATQDGARQAARPVLAARQASPEAARQASAGQAGPPSCSAQDDPVTCANKFLSLFDRPYQVALLIILGVGGGIGVLALALLSARGIAGVTLAESNSIARTVTKAAAVVGLLIGGYACVSLVGSSIHGLAPSFPLPSLQF